MLLAEGVLLAEVLDADKRFLCIENLVACGAGFPVNTTTFTFAQGLSSVVYNLFEPDVEQMIERSSAEMLGLIDKDGLAHPEDFPPCENTDACRKCRYQSACRLLEDAMHGKHA